MDNHANNQAMNSMSVRKEPRKWTQSEDSILADGFKKHSALQDGSEKLPDWSQIAAKLPGRTNKDCRKRWLNSVCGGLKKGPWTEDEDLRLVEAVSMHGTRWSLVAKDVGSRAADQCSKRWQHNLDPKLDHGKWTTSEMEHLLELVESQGREWKRIQEEYFPTRSANDLKNKYSILTKIKSNLNNHETWPPSEDGQYDGTSPAAPSLDLMESLPASEFEHDILDTPQRVLNDQCEVPESDFNFADWNGDFGDDAMMGFSTSNTGEIFEMLTYEMHHQFGNYHAVLSDEPHTAMETGNEQIAEANEEDKPGASSETQHRRFGSVSVKIDGCAADEIEGLIEAAKNLTGRVEINISF